MQAYIATETLHCRLSSAAGALEAKQSGRKREGNVMTGAFSLVVLVLSIYWLLWIRRQRKSRNIGQSVVASSAAPAPTAGTTEIIGVDLGVLGL